MPEDRRPEPFDAVSVFDAQRSLLVGVAYRVVGSVGDAEDVVQEAWLRWDRVDHATVRDPAAYLVRTVTRLAIDRLRRRQAQRESYVGQWLPEPLLTDPDPTVDPSAVTDRADSVSMAMLVVLESLSPLERSVFVLHEAFGYGYPEIAAILDRTPVAVRQLAHRAREHVQARRPRYETDNATRRAATERFMRAAAGGDLVELMALLAPDAVLWADGGGKVKAPLRPIHGRDKIARFLVGISGHGAVDGITAHIAQVNAGPAVVLQSADGPYAAAILDLDPDTGTVTVIRLVNSPDKLTGLGRTAPHIASGPR